MKINQHTNIVFLHQNLKKHLSLLYKSNKRQLSKWFCSPITTGNEQDFLELINLSLNEYAAGSSTQCVIFYKEDIIGYIGLVKINESLKKAELNYWIKKQFTDRGITIAACQKMINYAFNFLKLEKLEIAIDTSNIDYRKTCESLDFELEGILKHAENVNGTVISHAQYGLFKSSINS